MTPNIMSLIPSFFTENGERVPVYVTHMRSHGGLPYKKAKVIVVGEGRLYFCLSVDCLRRGWKRYYDTKSYRGAKLDRPTKQSHQAEQVDSRTEYGSGVCPF
jgi:hypothetical protein